MHQIFRELNLTPRQGNNTGPWGGNFYYFYKGQNVCFRWDGAGYDGKSNLVVIEEELKGVSRLHIEGHLSRIPIMQFFGERIEAIAWIVDKNDFGKLRDVVETTCKLLENLLEEKMPRMIYLDSDGESFGV